jgi:phosphoglycolate phosphatase-like HAD superfamily hydrolase
VQELVCGDDFATHKPEPEGMLRLLERTGTDPRQAVFIGDADVDVEGGSRAGVPTLLIRNGVSFAGRIEVLATRVFDNESDAYRHTLGLLG